jgi:hypothetical protein
MQTYFPKYFTTRAIIAYFVTLALVSGIFMSRVMPFEFVLFGVVSVVVFFVFANKLTMSWVKYPERYFSRKLFFTALFIRLVYVVVIYFYYISATGEPHAFHAADEHFYHDAAKVWYNYGLEEFRGYLKDWADFSDSGYCWWLAILYLPLGPYVLVGRVVKCFIDAFTCVLIYNLGKRNFSESAGRIAGIFYMLMPNAWLYCGVTLKEIEMAFMIVLFVERGDSALHSPKIKIQDLILPMIIIVVMLTFRTAIAAVLAAALVAALIFSSKKQLQLWKKILFTSIFAIWMLATVGVELFQETVTMVESRNEQQSAGYQYRMEREGGNNFAKYASASVFAPLIFTIPFSSMVEVYQQENQMMMNGANFVKNIISGLTILAMFLLLKRGDWRKHVLPISVMCGYLVVLVFSNFAHSERFHFPVLALELLFAAYGVTQLTNKHKRWYVIWLVVICIANIAWAWIKLAGRGLA